LSDYSSGNDLRSKFPRHCNGLTRALNIDGPTKNMRALLAEYLDLLSCSASAFAKWPMPRSVRHVQPQQSQSRFQKDSKADANVQKPTGRMVHFASGRIIWDEVWVLLPRVRECRIRWWR
jgi:hypothetical protein